jgi:Icc-related predicted phosphoesterase
VIRIAAVGDIHYGDDSAGRLLPALRAVHEHAELLLIAGDLTRRGTAAEAEVLAAELSQVQVPVVAVLGNHDYEAGEPERVRAAIEKAGAVVLEGEPATVRADGATVGVAGVKGFGGGFAGASGSSFGEPEMKLFMATTELAAAALADSLASLGPTDLRIALMHYAPIPETLQGERLEIYPFLGSYLLCEPVDRLGADLVLHGHAHRGREKGVTPGGTAVRNVAEPVLRHAYAVYQLGG